MSFRVIFSIFSYLHHTIHILNRFTRTRPRTRTRVTTDESKLLGGSFLKRALSLSISFVLFSRESDGKSVEHRIIRAKGKSWETPSFRRYLRYLLEISRDFMFLVFPQLLRVLFIRFLSSSGTINDVILHVFVGLLHQSYLTESEILLLDLNLDLPAKFSGDCSFLWFSRRNRDTYCSPSRKFVRFWCLWVESGCCFWTVKKRELFRKIFVNL